MAMPLLHVRWSAIKAWRRCHKLYDYRYNQHLERRKPVVPLIRGTIIGQCLDRLAENKSPEITLKTYEAEYGKLFKAEQEEYGDLIGECRRIVGNYKNLYAKDGLTYLKGKDKNPYEIEVETRFVLDGTKVRFTGHIDKLPQDKEGRTYVMDHKTHKVIPDEAARYNDLQLVTYVWLLPESGYEKPAGVIWDYLRTKPPTVPEVLKNGSLTTRANLDTDYDTFMQAIVANKLDPADYKERLDLLKVAGVSRYFQRVRLPAPGPALIKNVVEDFKATILEIRDSTRHGTFTRSMGKECSFCGMYQLCQAEFRGLDTDFIRRIDYMEKPHD